MNNDKKLLQLVFVLFKTFSKEVVFNSENKANTLTKPVIEAVDNLVSYVKETY